MEESELFDFFGQLKYSCQLYGIFVQLKTNLLKQRLKEEGNENVTNCHVLKMLVVYGVKSCY